MSTDKVTIKELLDLDQKWFVGQEIKHLEATIDLVLKPREVQGQKGIFWSQFIVIKDNTDKIGFDLTSNSKNETIPTSAKDRQIIVKGARGVVYKDKKNETQRKLSRGVYKLLDSEKPPQKSDVPDPKDDERQYWDHRKDKEQRIITKSALAKSLIEAGRKWGKPAQKEADGWYEWVMDGVEIREGYEAVKDVSKPIVKASKSLQKKVIKKLQSEEPNEISQAEVPEETPQRAAFRKTFHSLRSQLVKVGHWNDKDEVGGEAVENDYRNWLDSEFEVPSSTYLSDEEMEKGIKIMANWLNEIISQKNKEK